MKIVLAGGGGLTDLRVEERPDPLPPGPGEVQLDMLAMSINPADLLLLESRYGVKPPPPFTPGAEGVGRVRAVGDGVTELAMGDLAMPLGGPCWTTVLTSAAGRVVKLPADADLDQAAMLKANPATALAMLQDIVPLEPGDWVMQNAANSAVGVNVIQLARALGLRTLNIVRREAAAERLRGLGADAVIVHDGEGPPPAGVPDALDGAAPKLAFDAIGGPATNTLAALMGEGGAIASYGLLSGRPCEIDPDHLVFRDVRLRGFWLTTWFREAGPEKIAQTYAMLLEKMKAGGIGAPVLARHPIDRAAEAVARAAEGARDGKVLLLGPEHPEG